MDVREENKETVQLQRFHQGFLGVALKTFFIFSPIFLTIQNKHLNPFSCARFIGQKGKVFNSHDFRFKNMGHGSSNVLSIISLIIFCLFSFYLTHILIAKSSFNDDNYFNLVPTEKQVYNTGFNGKNLNQKQVLYSIVVEKFRLLLGFNTRKSRNGDFAFSPTPSPSPSPLPHTHIHAHPPRQHHHLLSPAQAVDKIKKKDKDTKAKRVTFAIFTSVGVIFVLCAIGLFLVCLRFKKQKKRSKRNLPIYRSEAGNKGISKLLSNQASVKKVNSSPGPDLFYLNSIKSALEPDNCCMKLEYETGKTYFNESMSNSGIEVDEREESNEQLIKSEFTTVHEITESIRCESVTSNEIVHEIEAHSSDDESFHSICNSHSRGLSNASLSSLTETLDNKEDVSVESQNVPPLSSSIPPPPPPPPPPVPRYAHTSPSTSKKLNFNLKKPSTLQKSFPPPPPPPPPQYAHTSPSTSIKINYTLKKPSTLPKSSSPGIPPPPCPPPITEGQQISCHNVPPPPPSQTPQIPLGKDGSPLAKLKPLHWDKVRAAPDRSTVWDKLRSSSFEFDEDMIESLFGYNLQNQMKNDEAKNKTPSPNKHVLDAKRFQNITILSKALNVTAEQVCGALIRGDGLSLQDLEALSKMVPTKDEEAKLLNYKGDILELGSAEKLVRLMLKIPFAFARIEAMLYKESFADEVHHLRKSFSMLEEACKELRSSRLFLKLLEAVLKTGNRMNVGTIRGEAKAFKLDALLKLADVKGTDGKTTLLHFVVQEIVRSEGIRVSESIMGKINQKSKTTKNEDKEETYRKMGLDLVTGLSAELCNVKKTATVDLDVIASSVAHLKGVLNKLQKLVHCEMVSEVKKGSFVSSMRSFLYYADAKLHELQDDENRVLLHVREITEYFHGNVSKEESNPLRIFVIVRDFLSMLDNVCKELKSSKAPRGGNPLAPFR